MKASIIILIALLVVSCSGKNHQYQHFSAGPVDCILLNDSILIVTTPVGLSKRETEVYNIHKLN